LPQVICNTSPLQYLHQLRLLHVLPALAGRVVVTPSVVVELAEGERNGVNVPNLDRLDWVICRQPVSKAALRLVRDLGPGETEVLALALESPDAMVILDDALGRRLAESFGIQVMGTLGVLLDAKRKGLVPAITPLLDELDSLRFRLAPHTRAAVLKLAMELP
jgi:uncharacterized protein